MEFLSFNASKNHLKRSIILKKTVSVPAKGFVSGSVNHSLGYVPASRVYYETGGKLIEAYGNVSINANIPAFDGLYVNVKTGSNTIDYRITGGNSTRSVTIIALVYLDDVA